MTYLTSIKVAFLVFPLIAFLVTIPFMLIQYHKFGSINKLRTFIIYSFILYLIVVYFLVILPLPSIDEVRTMSGAKPILIPFTFIKDIIKESSFVLGNPKTYLKSLCEPCVYTVIFNIFMTIPFGMYLRYYFKYNLKQTIKYTFLLSLFFELTQLTGLYFLYPKPYRVFDVDDLFTNTLGGIIGYLIMGVIDEFLPTREKIDNDTLKEAQIVSGLRRLTIFCLDMFLWLILTLFVYFIIQNSKYIKYITYIIYFIVIPLLWNGKTIGSSFLNVRVSFENKKLLRLIIKGILQVMFNIILPFGIIYISNLVTVYFDFQTKEKLLFLISVLLIVFIYYVIMVIHLLISKKMFYDKFSKVQFISTINERINNEENNKINI